MSIEQTLLVNIVEQILLLDENLSPNGRLKWLDIDR